MLAIFISLRLGAYCHIINP